MSSRMHSKPSRPWERGSPGKRRLGGGRGSPPIEHFRRRDIGSPGRSKRGKWESPSRNRVGSPSWTHRRGFESPQRAGRRDLGSPNSRRNFDVEHHHQRTDDEYRFHATIRQEGVIREGSRPSGLVFLCNLAAMRDCFHYHVLGLPVAQRDIVERVIPGTKLFLFNVETKELYGVFEAASCGGLNLVPEAFQDSKGAYAAQVRFTLVLDCLPLGDDKTRDVLRDNFSQKGKFDCELSPNQVVKILQLFSHTEIRPPQGRGWGNTGVQENRNVARGSNAIGSDALRLPQAPYLHENNMYPDPHLLLNNLNKSVADAVQADPASVLAQDVIDEVDQLAFKYLKNDPGYSGIRLEPVNTYLLSTSMRNHSFNHGQPNMPSSVMQPNGLQVGPFPSGMGHPGSTLSDSAKKGNIEQSLNDRGKMPNDNVSGSNPSKRGLLPVPIMHHQIAPHGMPPQQGVLYSVKPDLGGSHVPYHPLQGSHMIRPQMLNRPPLVNNQPIGKNTPKNTQSGDRSSNRYQGPKSFKKLKKNKHKKLTTEKGVGSSRDNKDEADARESSAVKPSGP